MSDSDMLSNFQKAMSLYQAMNESSQKNSETENPDEVDDRMATFMKLISFMQEQNKDKSGNDTHGQVHEDISAKVPPLYDEQIVGSEFNAFKAAVPYLDPKYQKTFAILLKVMELNKIFDHYSNEIININSVSKNSSWRQDMLRSIKPYLDKTKQNKADLIITVMDLKDTVNRIKEVN